MPLMNPASDIIDLPETAVAVGIPATPALASLRARATDFYELTKPRMNFLVVVTTMVGVYMATRGALTQWALLVHPVVGAVPCAIPPMMGWSAASNGLPAEAWALFGILFFWQMPHFLAIAILYRDDYAAGGFKMLPVVDQGLVATGRQMLLYGFALI